MALTDPSSRLDTSDRALRSRWHGARMTLDEFLALPEEKPYLEWDNGVVVQKDVPRDRRESSDFVPPQSDHGSLQVEVTIQLDRVCREGRFGKVFTETRMVTPGWAPVPDVSYIRRERIKPETRHRLGDLGIPPDLAVEIVSPDQTVRELLEKCLRYADVGVAVSLVVDSDDETVYAIRPGQPLRVLRGDDRIDLDDVLPGFDLTVRALFDSIVPAWLVDEPASEA
jgi:Uma2 family endonuclease